jgi:hypothetical protein
MSRANLQDSANPKPIMVGISQEPPRQYQTTNFKKKREIEKKYPNWLCGEMDHWAHRYSLRKVKKIQAG